MEVKAREGWDFLPRNRFSCFFLYISGFIFNIFSFNVLFYLLSISSSKINLFNTYQTVAAIINMCLEKNNFLGAVPKDLDANINDIPIKMRLFHVPNLFLGTFLILHPRKHLCVPNWDNGTKELLNHINLFPHPYAK